ncbi:MAG: hypothetical protein Q7T36_16180 [Fluviicoccus sp.]|uniref:hypothetical protein n=1 Tax=Fluviicoccus sp. TaxID=2003552 RepID=UPI00271FBEFD|nr:hypothetical protein [Fluviicoccus sp.]MDO8332004.1 hypothetical protein [Fluviicoccus sp.]
MKKMNEEERLAEQYLRNLNIGTVFFEPDGNNPPDFSVGNNIGVEVRRLNQNYHNLDGSIKGLEELAIPLQQRFERLLLAMGPSVNGESWFVGMDFRRPIGSLTSLERKLKSGLNTFMNLPLRSKMVIKISANFKIDFIRASKDHGTFFLFGASSDDDSGGWVMGELEKNIRLCILEKERKTAEYRNKYQEWWLILVDHIAYGIDIEERIKLRISLNNGVLRSFNKIILIDPWGRRPAFIL